MGGGGGKTKQAAAPPQAEPLNVSAIMGAATAGATAQIGEQYKQLIKNYPELERLSLGTVQKLSANLNNQETKDAQSYIRRGLAMGDLDPQAADPTSIEQALYDAGERDLALGRSLSPEQVRESQQASRAAFAARGLGTSLGSATAEVMNRDAMASARERERQGFAAAANDQYIGGITSRRMNLANLYFGGAGNLIQADPYERSVDRGLNYSGGTQNAQMAQIGNTFSSANQLAGGVASFNANLLDSRYNSYMNNQAALQAARIGAGAMNRSATMGMLGSAIQGGIQAGGMIGAAQFAPAMFSDKRMKKDIKPLGKAGSVLGLTAYEYSYKGEDKKHKGFMAQDVQKVLPEAVTEVEYKGKKRLAIRPDVIGAALAEELMTAKAA